MIVTRRFGADAWNQLFANVASNHPCFRSALTASSQIPLIEFLAFHDEMKRRLFEGSVNAYFDLGERSASWALEEGPYRNMIAARDVAQFVKSFPTLWRAYFAETTSSCNAKVVGNAVEFEAFDLPEWHPYFEYLIVGYMKGALGLLCVNPVEAIRIRGGSGSGYKYRFNLDGAGASAVVQPKVLSRHRPAENQALSPREIDVLRLIAQGKTDKMIAAVLGISDRTVQVHACRIYDKIGVANRAGAASWMVEHLRHLQ